jgi:CubicO group peptidase (beta-lactamase class C family)
MAENNKMTAAGADRRRLLAGAGLVGAASVFGITDVSATTSVKISKTGLDNLHGAMAAHVARGDVPGVVTLISRGADTHVDAIGVKAFGDPQPMRRDTIFRIASMTKPIAGAAAMMLVEDGKLRLDEPVDRLLPELANRRVLKRLDGPIDETVAAVRPILVSDLLTLRMGIGMIMAPNEYPISKAMTALGMAVGPKPPKASPDAWMKSLGSLPLIHQPGEVWHYHTGIDVAGVLIARASGQPLDEYLNDRIFAPLSMVDTSFSVPPAKLDRLSTSYMADPQTKQLEVFDSAGSASDFSRAPVFPSAGGGLVSTADDYHAFARMMLAKGEFGGRRILSERSVALMTTDHITAQQKAASPFAPGFWEKAGWGYGLATVNRHEPGDPRGCGWDGGYGTSAYWDPQTGVIGILLTQRMMDSPTPPPVHVDFWRSVYESVEG